MNKKYIVRLSDAERRICSEVVSELKGSSQKARRARILLQADADGPGVDGWQNQRGVWLSGSNGGERSQAICDGKF